MKHILILFIGALIMSSCLKSSGLPDNGTKLTDISMDTAGLPWQFGYTGNYITSITHDYPATAGILIDSIKYTNSNSVEYVTLSDNFNDVYTYTLTPSKLPLRIDEMYLRVELKISQTLPDSFICLTPIC